MKLNFIFTLAALVCAIIGTSLDFGWLNVDGDPNLAGWVFLTLGFWLLADLVGDR